MSFRSHGLSDYDHIFKLLLVGDSGIGKSCILTRFTEDTYIENSYATIGVDFKIRTIDVNDKIVKLQIWDTAGQERFKAITSSYYRGADAILFVFDLTNLLTLNNLHDWIREVGLKCNEHTLQYLIGSKSDLEQTISDAKITQFAEDKGFKYYKCSSKKDEGVSGIFESIAKDLVNKSIPALKTGEKEIFHSTRFSEINSKRCC